MILMRLLLVEDDKDLREFVREGLSRSGFVTDVAEDGQAGIIRAQKNDYDVIVMDVMMPHMDGITVLKTLRAQGYSGAILLTTCRGQEKDKVEGLNHGADDYLVKPYLLSELIARVRAVMRRTASGGKSTVKTSTLKAGPLQLDLLKREVRKGSKVIGLTKKEFDLLECFLRRPGQVLSQSVLTQHLSNADFNSNTNIVEVHMKNLRAKIDAKTGPSLIRTVRSCGYALDV